MHIFNIVFVCEGSTSSGAFDHISGSTSPGKGFSGCLGVLIHYKQEPHKVVSKLRFMTTEQTPFAEKDCVTR